MADRNDVNIKVGVTGAKKALDELTKVLDSYSKKEKAAQQIAHQAELNQLKVKEANAERLHRARTLKEAERIKQVLNNAKIESDAMTRNIQKIEQTARLQSALSDQASKAHKANNAKIQSDLIIQHATQRAILETSTRIAEAASREEVAAARIVKNKNDALRTEERAGAATNSRIASEVRLESTKEKSASQSEQNALREQNLAERLNNSRLIGINKVATEERRALQFNAQEERRVRAEALRERLAASREANAAERLDMAKTRFAQSQSDRDSRIARQQGGFFGGILGPQLGGAIETLGKLNLAFMVVNASIKPFVDLIGSSVQEFAKFEVASIGFNTQLVNMGQSIAQGNRVVKEFQDGISDPTAVMRAVQMMAPMNLSYKTQIELINAIRDGVVSMGGDVNEQLPLMVLAIRRGSSELLDNMAITKNAEEVYKEFAKSIGKKVSELKEEEKYTSLVNAVIKENQKVSGLAKQSADTLDGSMKRLGVTMREVGINIGSYISPSVKIAVDQLDKLSKSIAKIVPRIKSPLESLREQLPTKEEAKAQLMDAIQNVSALESQIKVATEKYEKIKSLYSGNELGQAQAMALYRPGAGDELKNLKQQLDDALYVRENLAKLTDEYIRTEQAANKRGLEQKLKDEKEAADRLAEQREKNAKQAEKDAKKRESEEERRRREAQKRLNLEMDRLYREGAARGATAGKLATAPRFGVFAAGLSEAKPGESLDVQRMVLNDNILKQMMADASNKAQLDKVIAQQNITTVLPKEQIDRLKKDREAIEKAIKDGAKDISEYQNKLDEIDQKIKEERIEDTANFLRSSYQVALQVLQGDFGAALSSIGETIGDAFVKNASELDVVQDFVGGLKNEINKFMTNLGTVDAFKLLGDGLVLYGMYKAVEIGTEIVQKFYNDVNKKIDEAKQLHEEPETLRQKKEKKISELQSQRSDLQGKQFWAGLAYVATGFGSLDIGNTVKNNLDSLNGSLGETDNQIKLLGESFDNDLSDPLSKASIALRQLTASVEMQTRVNQAAQKTSDFLNDIKTKTALNQIDIDEKSGKITKEEADKKRFAITMEGKTTEVISTLLESLTGDTTLKTMAKSYIRPYLEGKDISELTNGTYSSWDDFFQKNATWMTQSTGQQYTPEQLKGIFEPLKTFLGTEGKANAPGNMPGSSPDKPMYTQVVNVRDFREAFPDSAYFRAPSVDTTRSLNANAVSYR
jgi:hypothetical protein